MLAKSINKFYFSCNFFTTLYKLPYRTNNNVLHLIANDQPIDVQLQLRIMKYVMSNLKSTSSLIRLSTKVCMSGGKSFTCKSVDHIMSIYNLNKFQVSIIIMIYYG